MKLQLYKQNCITQNLCYIVINTHKNTPHVVMCSTVLKEKQESGLTVLINDTIIQDSKFMVKSKSVN